MRRTEHTRRKFRNENKPRNNNRETSHWKKYKELVDKANKQTDEIEKIKLLQQAEHYAKMANEK